MENTANTNPYEGKVVIVSCGVGRDSVAMLVGMHQRGIRPDGILFADVGSEKPETYAYIPVLQAWLAKVGFPELTIVRYQPKKSPYTTIEGNCVQNCTLPGATFMKSSCTMKWKVQPMNKHCSTLDICKAAWARGQKVVKLIGFEADEGYRAKRASDRAHAGKDFGNQYEYDYPLMTWGWDLKRCIAEIAAAGLPVPLKSACFFCPNQKGDEVRSLSADQRGRIIRMELKAEPFNRKIQGLWRNPAKKSGRPGTITEFILANGLSYTSVEELDRVDPMPVNPLCRQRNAEDAVGAPRLANIVRKAEGKSELVSEAEDTAHLEIIESL